MRLALAVLLLGVVGCRHRPQIISGAPVVVPGDPTREGRCIDRVLAKSRLTGYVEQTLDKEAEFFRVEAFNKLPAKSKKPRPVVRFFNVRCLNQHTAEVSSVGYDGVINGEVDAAQRSEILDYAGKLRDF